MDLAWLVDQQAVKDVMLRYARGIDRMDLDLVRSCYHEDALDERGPYSGDLAGFMAYLQGERGLPYFDMTSHFVGNQLAEIDGDTAQLESYCIAHHRLAGDGETTFVLIGMRYIDRLERRDGVWRIAHRRVAYDWRRTDKVSEQTLFPQPPPELVGRRDRDDAVYRR